MAQEQQVRGKTQIPLRKAGTQPLQSMAIPQYLHGNFSCENPQLCTPCISLTDATLPVDIPIQGIYFAINLQLCTFPAYSTPAAITHILQEAWV